MEKIITYSDLEQVLLGIGFSRRTNNGHVVYEQVQTDTRIPLPTMQPDDAVLPRHYLATRIILDNMGIRTSAEFDKTMKQHGSLPAGI